MLLGHCQKESKHAFLKRRCLAVNLDQIRFIEHWHTPRPVEGRASPTRPRGISQKHLAEAVRTEARTQVLGLRWKSNTWALPVRMLFLGGASPRAPTLFLQCHPVQDEQPGSLGWLCSIGATCCPAGTMHRAPQHRLTPHFSPSLREPPAPRASRWWESRSQELLRGLSLPPSHHQKKTDEPAATNPSAQPCKPRKVSRSGLEHCGAGRWGWGTAAVPLLQKDARVSLHRGGDGSLRSGVQELYGAGWEKPIPGADVYFDFNLRANSECSSHLEIQNKRFSPQIL